MRKSAGGWLYIGIADTGFGDGAAAANPVLTGEQAASGIIHDDLDAPGKVIWGASFERSVLNPGETWKCTSAVARTGRAHSMT